MTTPWQANVPYPQDGDPCNAATINRPDLVQTQREAYLKDRVDAAELGEGVVAHGVPIESAALVGQPVFWNNLTQQFELALATVSVDAATGGLVTAATAECLGLVYRKSSATLADILLSGRGRIDISAAVVGTATPGRYYLSGATRGVLVQQRPAASIPVCFWDGVYGYVAPRPHDFLENHVHLQLALYCKPAGGNSVVSGRHVITSPDVTQTGWLPAAHASFSGKAPVGAAFGYNLATHPALASQWPPVPLTSASFWFDDGGSGTKGAVRLPQGLNGLVHVNNWGIWWMSDCSGDVPWPTDYDAGSPPTPVPNNSSTPECPRLKAMSLIVSFAEMLFDTSRTVVTSLTAATGSLLTVTDSNGDPAKTGDLLVNADLSLTVDADNIDGARAVKDVIGGVQKRGYVVEGVFAGTNVSLSSTHTETVSSQTMYQGRLTLNVDIDPLGRELAPQIVRLDNAEERYHLDIPYLALPSRTCALRMQFNIPLVGLPASPQVKIRLLLLGDATGTLPVTATTYRLVARPGAGVAVALPTSDTTIACVTNLGVTSFQYREVTSDPISVTAGDTLYVKFARTTGDGYAGEVGILRAVVVIGSGA